MDMNRTFTLIDTELSAAEVAEDLHDAFVQIYHEGTLIATMVRDDYDEYNDHFSVSANDEALYLYRNSAIPLQARYPDKKLPDIIGFMLSQKLYQDKG